MRFKSNLPKAHFIDAGCVNASRKVTLMLYAKSTSLLVNQSNSACKSSSFVF